MNRSEPPHLPHWPHGVPRSIPTISTTLWENLEISARRYPDQAALIFFGRLFSYRELYQAVESLAGWLHHRAGVRAGDRVILMMQNSPQFVIGFYAVMRLGAAIVPVNPMTRAGELTHYIVDPQAKVALATADVAPELVKASGTLAADAALQTILVTQYADAMPASLAAPEAGPTSWAPWLFAPLDLPAWGHAWSAAMQRGEQAPPFAGKADDLAAICYTSGTTGKPKGCMHTHRTLGHNVLGGALWNGATLTDISLAVVPMFHITGMQFAMNQPIYLGATAVLMPRWDREMAGQAISRYGITGWINIPTMVIDLLASPNFASFDLASLRYIGGGGAAMPKAIAERLYEHYGLRYQEGYGLTETAAPSHSNPPANPKLQCLGIPWIGTESRVVDPSSLREMPPGEQGEIIIHGPQVFVGYWQNDEATAAACCEIDGKRFLRSGDLGYIDPDGYFFITDRLKRMINASGFKVWPAEVESLLYRHPDIQEACVVASLDAYRGETVKAFVVLRQERRGMVGAEAIVAWAREQMAAYKVPRLVEFIDQLPKSGSGKVMWRLLQEQEGGGPTVATGPSGP